MFVFNGFTIWLILFLILGILLYLVFFTKVLKIQLTNPLYIFISIIILLIFGITTITLTKSKSTSTNEPLTKEQCVPIYEEYNDTVLDITSDGLKGTIGIKINEEDCEATVTYNFLFNAELTKNFKISEYANPEYQYTGILRGPDEKRDDGDYAMIFYVLQNKDTLPDPYTMAFDAVDYGRQAVDGTTSTFVQSWQKRYTFKENRYDEILSKTIYEIVDGSDSMDITTTEDGGHSYSLDSELAAKNGNLVKSFTLTYTRR
jgi:hypothetical protein